MDGWAPASVNTETPNPADDGDGEAEEDLVAISQAGTPLKLNVPAHSSLDFGVSRDPSPAFSQSNVVIDDASFVPKPSTGASRAAQRSKDACPGRVRAVVLYCVLAATLFADQNVISPNMTMIGKEFGMKKEDIDLKLGGYVSFAFFVVGAPATLIAGYLTNCMNRQRLLLWLVLLGEAPSVLTYWVTQFWQLLALRMMSGISLGGALPVMYSLLGDFFPASQRSSVVAALIISTGAGQLVGPSVAGFLGPVIGWRWPFVIVALPALLAVGLVCLLTKEPPRGAAEPALQSVEGAVGVVTERITLAKVRRMLAIRTNALVFIQGLPGCLPWGFLSRFMVDFLHQDRGVSQAYATTLMVLLGLGAVTGVVLGGLAGQRLYNRQRSWMGVFSGFCVLAGLPPLLVLVNANMQELGRVLPLATSMALGFVASLGNPNLKSMVLNVNEPEARGIAMAVQTMLDDVSKGLAPLGVGILSKMMGRQTAFNIAALGWIPCSLLILGTGLTLAPDEDAMQARLADALALQMASLPPRTDAHGAALATDDESRSLLLNGSASHAPHGVLKLQPLAAEPVSLRNSSLRGV